jgi:hypothetical protein
MRPIVVTQREVLLRSDHSKAPPHSPDREFNDDKPLVLPLSFKNYWFHALDNVLAVMPRDDLRYFVNVCLESIVILHRDIENETGLHHRSPSIIAFEANLIESLVDICKRSF